jgi:uncharacterized protein
LHPIGAVFNHTILPRNFSFRSKKMRSGILLSATALLCATTAARPSLSRRTALSGCTLPNMRPPPSQRTYVSSAVDSLIASTAAKLADPNLATLFSNALPNALDTTVFSASANDTFIITGDIEAMWLRDSTNQVGEYEIRV